MRYLFVVYTVMSFIWPVGASAQTNTEPPRVSFMLTTGVYTPVLIESGDMFGMYIYVGPSVLIRVDSLFSVVAGVGFETAPKHGNYGGVLLLSGDYLVTQSMGIDVALIVAHDEDQKIKEILGRTTTAYISVGIGVSYFFKNGAALSPMLTYDINIDRLGNSVSPSVFFSLPIK